MAFQRPSLNPREPIADKGGLPTQTFLIYNRDLRADVEAAPTGFNPVLLEAQTTSIGTTAIPTDGDLSAGLYRVSWAAKVVTVAAVASAFQVTIRWTWKSVAQSWQGTLANGNLTTTYELSSLPLVYIDAASPITYEVGYISNPAAAMAYDFFLTLERLAAL